MSEGRAAAGWEDHDAEIAWVQPTAVLDVDERLLPLLVEVDA